MDLDLSKLTLSGWLLFFSALGVGAGGLAVFILLFPDGIEERGKMKAVCFAVVVAPTVGFFVAGKMILKKLGIPMLHETDEFDEE